MTNGKRLAFSRLAEVIEVQKFLDVDDGGIYYLHRLRRSNSGATVGVELTLISRHRLFRVGQMVRIDLTRRELL